MGAAYRMTSFICHTDATHRVFLFPMNIVLRRYLNPKRGEKSMKKALILAVALVLTSTACQETSLFQKEKVEAQAITMTDISTHWAAATINSAIQKGYVDGYEDSTFRPDRSVSRAEFVKMAVTAMK